MKKYKSQMDLSQGSQAGGDQGAWPLEEDLSEGPGHGGRKPNGAEMLALRGLRDDTRD